MKFHKISSKKSAMGVTSLESKQLGLNCWKNSRKLTSKSYLSVMLEPLIQGSTEKEKDGVTIKAKK